jgi:hypothetical protein
MIDFTIKEGKNTPEVRFYNSANKLVIKGKSFPENAKRFYDDVLLNFKAHSFSKEFLIELDFEYLSSSSVISVLEILKRFKAMAPETKFTVEFYCEESDDDMRSIAENYRKITNMNFVMLNK